MFKRGGILAIGVRRHHRLRGMTLVELMIVVSVLAILAAIVLPKFSSATDDAKAAHAVTTLKVLANAVTRYHLEHDDWPANVGRGVLPPELEPYLVGADMENDVTGGKWDYENWIGRGRTMNDGRGIGIAFHLRGGDQQQFPEIDRIIDDGDLETGSMQIYGSGNALLYLVYAE